MTDPVPPNRPFGRRPAASAPGDAASPPPGGGRRGGRRTNLLALFGALLLSILVAATGAYVAISQAYLDNLPEIPSRAELHTLNRTPGLRFLDRSGQLIAVRGPRYGQWVKLQDLPEHVTLAFLAAEDHRFYEHGPVDLQAIVRAAVANIRSGEVVQGGSTLSQQLAKDLFLTPEQTFRRKIQEAVLATRLERAFGKDEVLELYLNRIFFGANAYGVDGAAQAYFAKPAASLSLSEAALLAALPKAPSRLAPHRNMEAALARSHAVLNRMVEIGWITPAERDRAIADRPRLNRKGAEPAYLGYVLDYATAEVVRLIGPNAPPVEVHLSIDTSLQEAASRIVAETLKGPAARLGVRQAAVITLGEDAGVRAMVGGVDYGLSAYNRATQALRQPGSAFKPFVYAAALEYGARPGDVRQDAPLEFGDWRPQNYGGSYAGPVTLQAALARSINTVAVSLASEVGPAQVGSLAARFGIMTLPAQPQLSIALGAYEVRLIELAGAYSVFQHAGGRIDPWMVSKIRSLDGALIYERPTPAPAPVYAPSYAADMVLMLRQVIEAGTGTAARPGRPAAGKTGTSQDFKDAWFAGFTPDFTTVVWVGDDAGRKMRKVTGGDTPAEIWRKVMVRAHRDMPARDFDWVVQEALPDTPPADVMVEPGPQETFYSDLAADFDSAAASQEAPPPGETPRQWPDQRSGPAREPPGREGPEEGYEAPYWEPR